MTDRAREPKKALHRRALLEGAALLAGMAAACVAGAMPREAEAQAKTSQKDAHYQDHPNGGKQCSGCNYFQPPSSCQVVAGTISPNGWCQFFAPKSG